MTCGPFAGHRTGRRQAALPDLHGRRSRGPRSIKDDADAGSARPPRSKSSRSDGSSIGCGRPRVNSSSPRSMSVPPRPGRPPAPRRERRIRRNARRPPRKISCASAHSVPPEKGPQRRRAATATTLHRAAPAGSDGAERDFRRGLEGRNGRASPAAEAGCAEEADGERLAAVATDQDARAILRLRRLRNQHDPRCIRVRIEEIDRASASISRRPRRQIPVPHPIACETPCRSWRSGTAPRRCVPEAPRCRCAPAEILFAKASGAPSMIAHPQSGP